MGRTDMRTLYVADHRRSGAKPLASSYDPATQSGFVARWKVCLKELSSTDAFRVTERLSEATHVIVHLSQSDSAKAQAGEWSDRIAVDQIILCVSLTRLSKAPIRRQEGGRRQVTFFAKRSDLLNDASFFAEFLLLSIEQAWEAADGGRLHGILQRIVDDPVPFSTIKMLELCTYALAAGGIQVDGENNAPKLIASYADVQDTQVARALIGLQSGSHRDAFRVALASELRVTTLPSGVQRLVQALEKTDAAARIPWDDFLEAYRELSKASI